MNEQMEGWMSFLSSLFLYKSKEISRKVTRTRFQVWAFCSALFFFSQIDILAKDDVFCGLRLAVTYFYKPKAWLLLALRPSAVQIVMLQRILSSTSSLFFSPLCVQEVPEWASSSLSCRFFPKGEGTGDLGCTRSQSQPLHPGFSSS